MSGPDDDAGLSVGDKRFKNRVGPTAPESVTAMESRVCAPVDNPFSSGTDPVGVVLRNGNFRRDVFNPAAVKAGLDGLTPHELRHTAASLALSSGANVKAVQRMLGHASAAMTLDVYAGLFDDDLDGLADRMDEAHVYSMCTEARDDAKSKKTNVTQFHSATTELG